MLRLVLYIILLISAWSAIADDCDTPLVLSYNGDWKPYFYSYAPGRYDGADYTLLSQVMTALGCSVAVLPMTEARSSIELRKGSYDVSLGASLTQQRQQDFHYSLAYRGEQVGFVVAANNGYSSETRLLDILKSGGAVGLNTSGFFGAEVNKLKAQYPSQFIHRFSLKKRVRLLTQGTVDAIVDDRLALCSELRNMPSFAAAITKEQPNSNLSLILANEILHRDNIHFMFNKQTVSPAFVNRFNTQLKQQLQQPPVVPDCAI